MISVKKVDCQDEAQVRRFVELPYRLYTDCPQWLPPPKDDMMLYLNREAHPFYQHSVADFFIAVRDGRDVGRLAVIEDRINNQSHGVSEAWFYFFECEDDLAATILLFEHAYDWAKSRDLNHLIGPRGFTVLDGMGLLADGFQHPQHTLMTTYNFNYYPHLLETIGLKTKSERLVSYHFNIDQMQLPSWVHSVAEWVQQQHKLSLKSFADFDELIAWGPALFQMYSQLFGAPANNQSQDEAEAQAELPTQDIMAMVQIFLKMGVNPHFTKAIMSNEQLVGLVLGFSDLSPLLRENPGHLNMDKLPGAIEATPAIIFNGFGVIPEFQLQGLNAFLFSEMTKLGQSVGVNEVHLILTNVKMQPDMEIVGLRPHFTHRVYYKNL